MPVSELPCSWRDTRELILPKDAGTTPTRLLYCRNTLVRRDMAPMLGGREPDMPMPARDRPTTTLPLQVTPPQEETPPEHTVTVGLDPEHCQPERPNEAGLRDATRLQRAMAATGKVAFH